MDKTVSPELKKFIIERVGVIQILVQYAGVFQKDGADPRITESFYKLASQFSRELTPYMEETFIVHPQLQTNESFAKIMDMLNAMNPEVH